MRNPLDAFATPTRLALVALASQAVLRHGACILLPEDTDTDALAPALSEGLLEPCEGGYQFTDSDAHAQALAAALLPEADAAWDDPVQLLQVLHRSWSLKSRGLRRTTRPDVGVGGRLLLALVSAGRDVVSNLPALFAAAGSDDRVPVQQVRLALQSAVREVLPALDPGPEQVLAVGTASAARFQDAGDTAHNYLGLGMLAHEHPETARRALEFARALPARPEAVTLIPHLLHGLGAAEPDEALHYALELSEAENVLLKRAGVLALGGLPFQAGDPRIDRVFQRLEAVAAQDSLDLDEPLALSLEGFLARADLPRVIALLIQLSRRPHAAAAVARVLDSLSLHDGPAAFRDALLGLAANPALPPSAFESLRSALYKADPDFVLDVAEAWVTSRRYGSREVPSLHDAFEHVLDGVDGDVFGRRLPQWMASPEPRLQRAAADVVNHAVKRRWSFPPEALAELGTPTLLHLARQTLGRVHQGHTLASMALSFFDTPNLPKEVADLLTEALVDYVGFTRPAETKEVLRAVDAVARPAAGAVAADALARLEAIEEQHAALPRRTELVSPPTRVRAFVTARRRLERSVFKRVEEASTSPLKDLFAKVEVRGGKGFVVRMADGSLEAAPFQTHSVEGFSLYGDIVDPVGQAYRRIVWAHTPLEVENPDTPVPDAAASHPTT